MGVGLGAGMGVGNMMASAFNQPTQQSVAAQAPPPLPAMVQYFTGVNGKQAGPYTMVEVQQMVQAGGIHRDTMMWKTGMAGWAAADTIDEIRPLFGTIPPPLK